MLSLDDIWFAARNTRIVYMPPKMLETFGESNVDYTMVCEHPDNPGLARIRTGMVCAQRPRIITPGYYMTDHIENFDANARRYFEEVLSRNESARIIQYGLHFRKESYKEQVVSGNVVEIAEQAAKDAQDDMVRLHGVIIGSDFASEVSLMYFITKLVQRSLPHNARDFASHGLLGANPHANNPLLRAQIKSEMAQCNSMEDVKALGQRLREMELFDEFEDDFYELYRKFK